MPECLRRLRQPLWLQPLLRQSRQRRRLHRRRVLLLRQRLSSLHFIQSGRPRRSSLRLYSVAVTYADRLKQLDAARWRIAISLTAAMMLFYFGFILLVAYDKPLLGSLVVPGLSLGILLGAFVIVAAWVLIWIYVRWANKHYDTAIETLRGEQ